VTDRTKRRFRNARGPDRLRLPSRLIVVVAAALALTLVWSAFAEVERVVRAPGRLVPTGRAQVVQHLEGGIVAGILVHEGQLVERDAELVSIADVQAQAQVGERTVRLNALRAQLRRLRLEAQGGAGRAAGGGADPDANRELLVYAARREKMEQSIQVLQAQLEQKRQEIREAETTLRGRTREHAVAVQQLAVVSEMITRQAASRLELLEAQSRVERFKTQIQEIEASVPKIRSVIRELEGKISELGAQFRSEARSRLAEVEVEVNRLEEEINAGKDRLQRTAVRAPTRGVVNRLFTNTIGGVVRPGDPLVEITPLGDKLTLEASILPQDRAEVLQGLPAVIRVSAYDYATYGTLSGTVSDVSADTLPDENSGRYYRVRIDVDPESLKAFGRDLMPGMTASADIVLGKRTILAYVAGPLLRFRDLALRDRR
jgi:adhesin transport system membrane fusion protein